MMNRTNNAAKEGGRRHRIQLFPRDPFGNVIFLKRMLIGVVASLTYHRFNIVNRLQVEGMEHLHSLPDNNVLFISNHQTYYSDVMAFYHILSSAKWGFRKGIDIPLYVFNPRARTYYVAAEETMKQSGWLPKIFSLAGAVTVKRSWRAGGQDVQRGADISAPVKMKKALDDGWLISFPQGTTSPYAPVRKGTASLIKAYNPLVVPIVIDGFRRAFDKKGLVYRKKGALLKVRIKPPMHFGPDDTVDQILQKVAEAIEQVPPVK